jgi:hypothetical protein
MDKQQRTEMYRLYLQDEGYKPEVDSDGDVRFKKEGRTYVIIVDQDDEAFFTVVYPQFWKIESEDERRRVLTSCDHANNLSKVAKVFTVQDNVWAATEMFVSAPEGFKPVFDRAMSALQNCVSNFAQHMRAAAQTKEESPNASTQEA